MSFFPDSRPSSKASWEMTVSEVIRSETPSDEILAMYLGILPEYQVHKPHELDLIVYCYI